MKKHLLTAAVAIATAASFAVAAPKNDKADKADKHPINPAANTNTGAAGVPAGAAVPAAGQQAGNGAEASLKQFYGPNVQMHKTQDWDANGVKVEYYTINTNGGQSSATVTERGDLITTGLPIQAAQVPAAAQQTMQLFKVQPSHLIEQQTHNYSLAVKGANNQAYVIEIDSVGQIVDIKSPLQIREDAPTKLSGAAAASAGQLPAAVKQQAAQHFGGVTIDGGSPAVHDPGYYSVFFHNQTGRGWAILNEQGDVLQWRNPIAASSLPPAVQKTLNEELKGDKITNIEMGNDRLYQATLPVGGENVVLYVRPNGDVERIESRRAHKNAVHGAADAVNAGAHQSGAK